MTNKSLIQRSEDDMRWDNGELGRDMEHAVEAKLSLDEINEINAAADLQMISIRLPSAMIDDFKSIAAYNGIRYQTLMKQVLGRFAHAEIKRMASEAATAQINARKSEINDEPDRPSLIKYG